jgi:hypothetical protein
MVAARSAFRGRRLTRWSPRRVVAVAAALAAGSLAAVARQAYSHPLHTTLTQVTVRADGALELVLRAFVDDFAAAVSERRAVPAAATSTPHDSATARYLEARLVLADAAGQRLPLRIAGIRRASDVIWVTLRSTGTSPGSPVRLTNRVLFERFDDQVNIVQASVAGRRQTLLFTKREGAATKSLAP